MFEHALVALDLTPAEQPIVDCLPDLQRWGVRRVTLTHVIQVGYAQGAALAYQENFESWLERLARPLRDAGLDVTVALRASGSPADEILAAATEHAVDLLVIGSRGHNLLRTVFLGSVARAVIRKTTVPLLLEWIEPSADATRQRCEAVCTDTLRHVLLATDFSTSAAAAEAAALHLAKTAAHVDCVYVSDPTRDMAMALSPAHAQSAMHALVQRVEASGTRAHGLLLDGVPSTEIAEFASRQDVSLIVVGKRGQNPLASLLIGSTAAALCETAGRPVLMVP